jgi:hypothetical protein
MNLVIKSWMVVARFALTAWPDQAIVLLASSYLVGVKELRLLSNGQAITKYMYYYKLLGYQATTTSSSIGMSSSSGRQLSYHGATKATNTSSTGASSDYFKMAKQLPSNYQAIKSTTSSYYR